MTGVDSTLLAFGFATLTAAVMTPGFASIARQLGLVAPPRVDRWGARPTPLLGGAAILVATLLPVTIFAPLAPTLAVIGLAAIGAFILGLIDDVRGLRPSSKLVGQVAVASVLAFGGVRVEIIEWPPIALALTLLWTVGLMNAINLIDNMDGLAAGTAAIAAAVLVLMAPVEPLWVRPLAAAVAGGCIGFLMHNFAPARVYMGDAGSLTLGCFLAGMTLVLTNTVASNVGLAVVAPLLVLGLPLFDTALVTVTRRLEGRPVGRGGRDHTSHRLASLGLGERATVVLLYAVAAGFALLGYLAVELGFALLPITALALVGLVLFGVFLAEIPAGARVAQGRGDPARQQMLGMGRVLVRFGGEIALDVVLATAALFSAYLIRFEHLRPQDWMYLFVQAAPVVIPLQLAAFVLTGVYRTLWRFLSVTDAVTIVRAVAIGTTVAAAVLYVGLHASDQSRAVFLIDAVLFAAFVVASRSFLVWLRHWSRLRQRETGRRVLIVGADESGETALRLLLRSEQHAYRPVGFIDDDPGKLRRRIAGVPVLGSVRDLAAVAEREGAELVVLASDDMGSEAVRATCLRHGIELREFTLAVTDAVLVTGGAGFIGSHLVDRLLDEGASVTVLDDLSTGKLANLGRSEGRAGFEFIAGSILDTALVETLVARHSLVFHLAAAVGVRYIVEDPLSSVLTNVRGTENVLGAAHRSGARVLLASTSEIYGRSREVPFREDGERVLGPTWVHRWSYSTAKAIDEHLAFAYAERGLRMSVVRYFNSYGPRIDERGYGSVIARFAAQALRGAPLTVHGDGQQTRCFTYVADTVDGTLRAARVEAALGRVFNIGNEHEVTILQLAERIRSMVGSSSPIELVPYETLYPRGFEDTRRRVPDVGAARQALGFSARVPLEDGLRRTLDWCALHYGRATTTA
jgi:nucleoside-diphosphate-sugar epimerase/UDP-N-acetylmuramyl pentapeptide phosphotransferase/UDP-N-acetylglucosamine-1-phosphate transferase